MFIARVTSTSFPLIAFDIIPYEDFCRFANALDSLAHVLLLAPQNPFYFLQAAETAYTAGDIPLALKMFLIVVEMTQSDEPNAKPKGISVRAWYGVKLVRRMHLALFLPALHNMHHPVRVPFA
jgi:hypothetical protein